ncbi:MAG TPA: isochorismate synthase [Candidatus Sulfomarinibacteraceae bacterium]|nr:isochorismate synthase [Candidatus Sulfomarinibacteraceae bacterium]
MPDESIAGSDASRDWERESGPVQSPSPTYRSSADGRLVSYARPAPGISASAFLAQARGQERFFWEDVRDSIVFAGFGVAVNLLAWGQARFEHVQEQARALFSDAVLLSDTAPPLAAPRLFGGFSFRHDFTPDYAWASFHPAHFVLPHYQLVEVDGEAWLTINALLGPDEDPADALPELQEALDARYEVLRGAAEVHSEPGARQLSHGEPLSVRYPLSYEAWAAQIAEAKRRFESTPLKKVVLSRVCELRFGQQVGVDGALRFLNEHYADSYRFLFEPRPYHAFFGATPELLVKVQGATLTSMALAGSIGRSADGREDEALGQQLLNSEKDRYEHQVVVMSLLERLAPLTSQLEISPQPGVYKLRNIQHLFTPVRGTLLQPEGILPLVRELHPTPALGGSPRRLAMDFIREAEPVPRGWYAAPLGWIDYQLNGAFAVAIRSAVSEQRRVWMYAGSGIVADSDAQKEWEETEWKFRPMLEALGVG